MGKLTYLEYGEVQSAPSRLPAGYTKLAYIESSGTQHIDTGFKHNQNTRVVMDAQVTKQPSTHAWLFEGRITNNSSPKGVLLLSGTDWCADYNHTGTRYHFTTLGITDRLLIDYDRNTITINGESHTWTATTFQSTANLVLLAANTNGTVSGHISAKLYSCQIYDNGVLVRDFVPCITDDGEIGLYDLVGKKFYGNAGTGVFVGEESYSLFSVQNIVGTAFIASWKFKLGETWQDFVNSDRNTEQSYLYGNYEYMVKLTVKNGYVELAYRSAGSETSYSTALYSDEARTTKVLATDTIEAKDYYVYWF